MERLRDGDRSAFDPVYAFVRPVLESFAARMLGPNDAGDVAQQTLLDVFSRAGEFDPSRDALNWILGIAAWNCRTARKRTARRREEPPIDRTSEEPSPEEEAIRRDTLRAIEAVLGELAPLDVEAILAAIDRTERPAIEPAAFRKRVQRALTRLRSAWGARHGVD
jgi:DNA-directed RNA polymerase specialized sigma24 family protein